MSRYDYDDWDDGYDDDYYGDDYDDGGGQYGDRPAQGQTKKTASKGQKAPSTLGAMIGGGSGGKKKKKGKGSASVGEASGQFPAAPYVNQAPPKGGSSDQQRVTPFTFDTPSPDQAVLLAQAGEGPQARGSASGKQRNAPLTPHQHDRPHQEEPTGPAPVNRRPLSEYIPESLEDRGGGVGEGEASMRKGLHLVVVGHVDAGKSTLMGHLLQRLGKVSVKDAERAAREARAAGKASFAFAWALDQRQEERERGVTVDVALASFRSPGGLEVTLLDAPGHRDFVPHMLQGASQADAAVLVVDASPGEFESGFQSSSSSASGVGVEAAGGQTREHAQLVRSLGVEQLIVAVNKMDVVDWAVERFLEVQEMLTPFLKSLGFKSAGIQWVAVSGLEGVNLTCPPDPAHPLAAWGQGLLPLLDSVDQLTPPQRHLDKPLRMPVAEVAEQAHNRQLGKWSVGGKVEGGSLVAGGRVLTRPGGHVLTVKGLVVGEEPAVRAQAGDCVDVGLNLPAKAEDACWESMRAGVVLCHPDFPVPICSRFEARLVALELRVPILQGTQVVLHCHTDKVAARVSRLLSLLDAKTGETTRSNPRCVASRQVAVVEVEPERPVCLELYSDYRALGRVTLRNEGITLAVGVVTAFKEVVFE